MRLIACRGPQLHRGAAGRKLRYNASAQAALQAHAAAHAQQLVCGLVVQQLLNLNAVAYGDSVAAIIRCLNPLQASAPQGWRQINRIQVPQLPTLFKWPMNAPKS